MRRKSEKEIEQEIQIQLNAVATVIRRYNLGNEDYFVNTFKKCKKSQLYSTWSFTQRYVLNKEIIKDCDSISDNELVKLNDELVKFNFNSDELLHYLRSEFDPKLYKLSEENIERRLRHLLAERYIRLSYYEIIDLQENLQAIKDLKNKQIENYNLLKAKYKNHILFLVCFLALFFFFDMFDRLTPVQYLTYRIHEKSKYKFDGAVCNDGSISHSQGRGTCSWHDGVNHYFYEGNYAKTLKESKIEAIELSLIDNIFSENPFEKQNWAGELKYINSNKVCLVRINCLSENNINLYYPNTGCSGTLEKIGQDENKYTFIENLQTGKDLCTNNGKVIIEFKDDLLLFKYYWPQNKIVAKGFLKKVE